MRDVVDPRFLPFTVDELLSHMPPQEASAESRHDKWISHFVDSAARYRTFVAEYSDRRGVPITKARRANQIEKDERFWVATAFMGMMRAGSSASALSDLLSAAYGSVPPVKDVDSWSELVQGPTHLYLEARLPSPPAFQEALAKRVDEHPVEYVRYAARKPGVDEIKKNLEGGTNVDGLLVNPETGFGLLVEAKVMSDVSHDVSFDATRNQIARNVDVMLEDNPYLPSPLSQRRPDRSFFLLLTPQLFIDNPESRHYGWLMSDYRGNPDALRRDLPHRGSEVSGVGDRLGWTSWESMNQLVPGSCPWLKS